MERNISKFRYYIPKMFNSKTISNGQFLSPLPYQNSNRIHNTSFIRAVQIARVTTVLKQPIGRIDQTAIRAGLREQSRNNLAFFPPRTAPWIDRIRPAFKTRPIRVISGSIGRQFVDRSAAADCVRTLHYVFPIWHAYMQMCVRASMYACISHVCKCKCANVRVTLIDRMAKGRECVNKRTWIRPAADS